MIVVRWRIRTQRPADVSLRARCEERVRELGLPAQGQLTIDGLCEVLGHHLGRQIRLLPLPLPQGSPHGLWVHTRDEDIVLFESRQAPVHQRHVVMHELGHLICDHEAPPVISPDASRLLLPSLNPALVQRVLGRDHSQTEAEIEAETVGDLLSGWVNSWTAEWQVPPEIADLVKRLSALENPHSREI
ncbi:ImmA/IrrE family metallo-endopeptidase [Streptomyces decoyicus]|uniref:ImmA/IrrE family metallo-endopeptidase n=1 Tax=Streptomyces decoyicus TaxID=249567 RepID=UPI0038234C03